MTPDEVCEVEQKHMRRWLAQHHQAQEQAEMDCYRRIQAHIVYQEFKRATKMIATPDPCNHISEEKENDTGPNDFALDFLGDVAAEDIQSFLLQTSSDTPSAPPTLATPLTMPLDLLIPPPIETLPTVEAAQLLLTLSPSNKRQMGSSPTRREIDMKKHIQEKPATSSEKNSISKAQLIPPIDPDSVTAELFSWVDGDRHPDVIKRKESLRTKRNAVRRFGIRENQQYMHQLAKYLSGDCSSSSSTTSSSEASVGDDDDEDEYYSDMELLEDEFVGGSGDGEVDNERRIRKKSDRKAGGERKRKRLRQVETQKPSRSIHRKMKPQSKEESGIANHEIQTRRIAMEKEKGNSCKSAVENSLVCTTIDLRSPEKEEESRITGEEPSGVEILSVSASEDKTVAVEKKTEEEDEGYGTDELPELVEDDAGEVSDTGTVELDDDDALDLEPLQLTVQRLAQSTKSTSSPGLDEPIEVNSTLPDDVSDAETVTLDASDLDFGSDCVSEDFGMDEYVPERKDKKTEAKSEFDQFFSVTAKNNKAKKMKNISTLNEKAKSLSNRAFVDSPPLPHEVKRPVPTKSIDKPGSNGLRPVPRSLSIVKTTTKVQQKKLKRSIIQVDLQKQELHPSDDRTKFIQQSAEEAIEKRRYLSYNMSSGGVNSAFRPLPKNIAAVATAAAKQASEKFKENGMETPFRVQHSLMVKERERDIKNKKYQPPRERQMDVYEATDATSQVLMSKSTHGVNKRPLQHSKIMELKKKVSKRTPEVVDLNAPIPKKKRVNNLESRKQEEETKMEEKRKRNRSIYGPSSNTHDKFRRESPPRHSRKGNSRHTRSRSPSRRYEDDRYKREYRRSRSRERSRDREKVQHDRENVRFKDHALENLHDMSSAISNPHHPAKAHCDTNGPSPNNTAKIGVIDKIGLASTRQPIAKLSETSVEENDDGFIIDSDEEGMEIVMDETSKVSTDLRIPLDQVEVDEELMERMIYISNIAPKVHGDTELSSLFEGQGVATDPETGFPAIIVFTCHRTHVARGDAQVTFVSSAKAAQAIREFQSKPFGLSILKVRPMDSHTMRVLAVQCFTPRDTWICANPSCRKHDVSVWTARCDACQQPRLFAPSKMSGIEKNDWVCSICFASNGQFATKCGGCQTSLVA